jgi:hypothetical protein
MHSFPYLSNRLAQISSVVEVPVDEAGWIPFSIPLIIKQLVGDALTWVRRLRERTVVDFEQT